MSRGTRIRLALALGAIAGAAAAIPASSWADPCYSQVCFQTGGGQATALFETRANWIAGPTAAVWDFTVYLVGPPTACVGYYAIDGVKQPSNLSACVGSYEFTVPVGGLGNGTHQIVGYAYIPTDGGAGAPYWIQNNFSFKVDNSTPTVAVSQPLPQWRRGTTTVAVAGQSSGPSGVAGDLCNGAWLPGAQAQLQFAGTGQYQGTCQSQSGAGLPSAPKPYDVLADNTAPSAVFESIHWSTDPRDVVVDVADSGSGVAGGTISLKWPDGTVHAMPTTFNQAAGTLTGFVDDDQLPAGTYEATASVSDAVGNTTTTVNQADGTPLFLPMPLRTSTVTVVGTSQKTVQSCSVKRVKLQPVRKRGKVVGNQKARAKLVRTCTSTQVPAPAGPLRLSYGQAAAISGVVQTSTGQPLAGAPVTVSAQVDGGAPAPVATLTTAANGDFTYSVPAGPSRTLTFQYPGTATLHDSQASTAVQTTGAGWMYAKKTIRAGSTLVLSGQVAGGFIPAGGEIVQLWDWTQLAGWQPFEKPVYTDSTGRWRVAFKTNRAARGQEFRIRAALEAETGWPYASATTRTVRIRVT